MKGAERAIHWIEAYCVVPHGPDRGLPVRLTATEREIIGKIYDNGGTVKPISGQLAACLALLHLCGPEFRNKPPPLQADSFSVWNAAAGRMQEVLERRGETIICPQLGTKYPMAL